MRTNFDNCKVRIANAEESRKVQEKLSKLGYEGNADARVMEYSSNFPIIIIRKDSKWYHQCIENSAMETDISEVVKIEEVTVADILGEEQLIISKEQIGSVTAIQGIKIAKVKEILDKVAEHHPDWLKEPKKTLSNKWIVGDFTTGESFSGYHKKDVKEALKRTSTYLKNQSTNECQGDYETGYGKACEHILKDLKEDIGEELL